MRKVELSPTQDCEAGYGPAKQALYVHNEKPETVDQKYGRSPIFNLMVDYQGESPSPFKSRPDYDIKLCWQIHDYSLLQGSVSKHLLNLTYKV